MERCCANFGPFRARTAADRFRAIKGDAGSAPRGNADGHEWPSSRALPFPLFPDWLQSNYATSLRTAAMTFDGNDTLSSPAGGDPDGTANLTCAWIIAGPRGQAERLLSFDARSAGSARLGSTFEQQS